MTVISYQQIRIPSLPDPALAVEPEADVPSVLITDH